MNAFDFDNTIFRGDSTARFYAYCYAHVPALWITIPGQLGNALLFACKIRNKQDFKERMYRSGQTAGRRRPARSILG